MLRRGIEDLGEQLDQHRCYQPAQYCPGDQAADKHQRRLAPDEGADLTRASAQGRGDRQRAAPFLEAKEENQTCAGSSERDRERQFDARETANADGGQA